MWPMRSICVRKSGSGRKRRVRSPNSPAVRTSAVSTAALANHADDAQRACKADKPKHHHSEGPLDSVLKPHIPSIIRYRQLLDSHSRSHVLLRMQSSMATGRSQDDPGNSRHAQGLARSSVCTLAADRLTARRGLRPGGGYPACHVPCGTFKGLRSSSPCTASIVRTVLIAPAVQPASNPLR